MANNSRKAKNLYSDVNEYLQSTSCGNLPSDQLKHLVNLRANLGKCANHSMFREYSSNGALEYIASQTCKHKLCPICNYERQRNVRLKYRKFFEGGIMELPTYKEVAVLDADGDQVYVTDSKKKFVADSE